MKTAIVIGAGAGGCAVATQLAQSGKFHVDLLEAGKEFHPFEIEPKTLEPLRRAGLFLDPRMISILFPDMRVGKSADMVHVWGKGLGGTTNLATSNRVRYDSSLRALGIDLDQEFEELEAVVPASTDHETRWNKDTRRAWTAFEELGFDPVVTPKMTHHGKCCYCGKCVLGCKFNAKWTADELLKDAPEDSVTVHEGTTVEGLIVEDGIVRQVLLKNGTSLQADVVVLAAGGIGTPKILERSGIACQPTFFGDPVLCVAAPMPKTKQNASLPMPFIAQRDGYILAPYFDYLSFFFSKDWRLPAQDIFSLMIKLADEETGSITPKRIEKSLTNADYETLARAVDDCYAIFEKMGVAKEDTFLGLVNEGHPGGTLPLTEQEAETLHNDALPSNLYLADSTLFPSSMGNPPIMTIMALAKKVGKTICETI